jgi:hypothetical protein
MRVINPFSVLLNWRLDIPSTPPSSVPGKKINVNSLEECNLEDYAQNVQGVFVNLDIEYMDIALMKLRATAFSKIFMNNGLVFIWTDKRKISELIEVMADKEFKYAENLVFSVFDYVKLSGMLGGLVEKNKKKKKRIESYFKAQEDAFEKSCFDWKETMELLLKAPFELNSNDSIEKYFLKFPSEFISTNKRTLLIFRRVS